MEWKEYIDLGSTLYKSKRGATRFKIQTIGYKDDESQGWYVICYNSGKTFNTLWNKSIKLNTLEEAKNWCLGIKPKFIREYGC